MTQPTPVARTATIHSLAEARAKRDAEALRRAAAKVKAPALQPTPAPQAECGDGYAGRAPSRVTLGAKHAIMGAFPIVGIFTNGFMTLGAALSFTSSDPNLGRAGRIAAVGALANLAGTIALFATHHPAALLPLAAAGALEVKARLQLPVD